MSMQAKKDCQYLQLTTISAWEVRSPWHPIPDQQYIFQQYPHTMGMVHGREPGPNIADSLDNYILCSVGSEQVHVLK